MKDFPRSTCRIEFREQYRNMKVVLDKHPQIVEYALETIKRAGSSRFLPAFISANAVAGQLQPDSSEGPDKGVRRASD
jgi:hypothetical protein